MKSHSMQVEQSKSVFQIVGGALIRLGISVLKAIVGSQDRRGYWAEGRLDDT